MTRETTSDNPFQIKILTPQEVRLVARRIKAMLPAEIFQFSRSRSRSIEDTLRIGSLAKRCHIEREKLGLTVKQAGAQAAWSDRVSLAVRTQPSAIENNDGFTVSVTEEVIDGQKKDDATEVAD